MRGKQAPKRQVAPDRRYNDDRVSKFINYIMLNGKKTVAERIVYGAFDIINEKTGQDGYEVWQRAMRVVSPNVEVRARRIGGANYQVPVEVRPERRFTLASRWIIDAAKKRKGKPMADRLAEELIAAANEDSAQSAAVKKKEDEKRMADANKAFAHFR